ncbi:Uncharacterised protein [Chromobacterium violaceum]|uniref:Transposase DDE domain-containing protein n=1 Tax=Chromobacterium violaceum TaxID=536 RepID=A0AAX2MFH6_CHRVL|nr:Uncharacterised protein [Chromobacterium violaceum]SUY93461.1 Uncharacterised protein [Chromobacterium violaceum]
MRCAEHLVGWHCERLAARYVAVCVICLDASLLHGSFSTAAWQDSGMTKPAPKRYCPINWKAYNQALIQRGSLSVWLDTSMSW